jgi:alkylation response protein AidB-like acyl-CoA dehydrogenase
VAQVDLTAARILEAHCDALAILGEAGQDGAGRSDADGAWGVFAAEAPGVSLEAHLDGGQWRLDGTKPWCSLGSRLDHALVTAEVAGGRRLFAVDLDQPSVTAQASTGWVSRGLHNVPSGPVHFHRTPAQPVGGTDWYLNRAGFSWGALGVAACWLGGERALAATLQVAASGDDNPILQLQLGRVDAALHGASAALSCAAEEVDRGTATGSAGQILALRVRSVIAEAAETTLRLVGHALGPSVLAFDETHARRVADLQIYLRQHHAERDLAMLGRLVSGPVNEHRSDVVARSGVNVAMSVSREEGEIRE